MGLTPDRAPGASLEEELQLEDRTTDGDPTIVGAIRRIGDDVRFRQSTGVVSLLDALWKLATGNLQPLVDGQGARFLDSAGTAWATIVRGAGNLAITVGGVGSKALYKNCDKEVTQLGGSTASEYAQVSNYGDSPCHTIYGDRTTKSYGNHRLQNADTSTEYLDVGRDGTNAYLTVGGGAEILKATMKILESRLNGSTTAEMFRVVSNLGDVFKAFADRTARFFGNVTHEGNVLPDGNNTREVGSSSARWMRGYFQTSVRLTSGGIGYTELRNGNIRTVNSILDILGGFGWRAKVTHVLGDAIFQFVGSTATQKARPRAFYGPNGSNWTDISHDGTVGAVSTGAGNLELDPVGDLVVSKKPHQLPSYTVTTLPSASPAGQMIYVSDETGGGVPAFSDGTNWRRVTDRAIVS